MLGTIARGFPGLLFRSRDDATTTAPQSGSALLAWYGDWLRRRQDAVLLREIEPHRARDLGIAPGPDRCPEGYVVDPRPLWGIGLTPSPRDGGR